MTVLIVEKVGEKIGVLFDIESSGCADEIKRLARLDKEAAVSCALRNGKISCILGEDEIHDIEVGLRLTESNACGA